MLTSIVHGGLVHVARSTTIVDARAVAMLSDREVSMRRVEAYTTSTINGSLKLGQVVRARKGLLGASVTKLAEDLSIRIGEEESRTTEGSLLHHGRVAKLLDKSLTTLDRGIGYLSSLGGTEADPATALNAIQKSNHAVDVSEVDEGVSHVAARLEVDAQVDKVESTEADIVEDRLERQL